VLSLPTKEYFQSSGWVEERPKMPLAPTRGRNGHRADAGGSGDSEEHLSVRSGSEFWAGRQSGSASSAFTASQYMSEGNTDTRRSSPSYSRSQSHHRAVGDHSRGHGRGGSTEDEDDDDSQGTEVPEEDEPDAGVVDEVGAQDAFVAGMIYALSRRITPGSPYTPSSGGEDSSAASHDSDRGRWRLDECLRYVQKRGLRSVLISDMS
jgi:hypothetical protein